MRSIGVTILMLAAGLAVATQRAQAQDAGEYIPPPEAETEFHADMFPAPPSAPVRREDAVNYRISGKVRAITDGDTIALTGKRNVRFVIRLSDMDTPETSHRPFTPRDCKCAPVPFRPGQVGGRESTEVLRGLVAVGDEVTAECYELDDYGRSICHVFKGGVNVNLEMIRRGWGWLPERREWIRDEASAPAEQAARAAGRGAWALGGQRSPSEWRKQCWRGGECDGAVNWPDRP